MGEPAYPGRMTAAKLIDPVVSARLAKTLKAAGFKKAGRTFRRVSDDVVHVVNVQASGGNAGDYGQFTLKLA